MQKTHENTGFVQKNFPLIVVAHQVFGPANQGSLFRLADAFNIEKIIFCDTRVDLTSNRLKKTARATHQNTPFEERENTLEICLDLKNSGHTLLALEIAESSIPIQTLDYSKIEKPVLIVGNENYGIADHLLQLAHHIIHINMFGQNSSMNVAQATAISLFEITKSLQPVS